MARPRATRANAFAALLALGPRVRRRHPGPPTQARGPGVSCARTTWSASSTTSPSSRPASTTTPVSCRRRRDQLRQRRPARGGGAEGGPGPARRPAHPGRYGARQGARDRITINDPGTRSPRPCARRAAGAARRRRRGGADQRRARVVASSLFGDRRRRVQVDGTTRRARRTASRAIGDPQTMAAAMEIPGGITETVRGQRRDGPRSSQDQSHDHRRVAVASTRLVTLARSRRPLPRSDDRLSPSDKEQHERAGLPRRTCVTPQSTSGCASGDDGVVRDRASPPSPRTPSATSSTSACRPSATPCRAGDSCGEVESTKSVSDLYAPLAGEVTAVNDALDAHARAGQLRPLRRGLDVRAAPRRRRRARRPDGRRGLPGPARLTPRAPPHAPSARCGTMAVARGRLGLCFD